MLEDHINITRICTPSDICFKKEWKKFKEYNIKKLRNMKKLRNDGSNFSKVFFYKCFSTAQLCMQISRNAVLADLLSMHLL